MNPVAYPLQWPEGWPRIAENARHTSRFKTTLPAALAKLEDEVRMLPGRGLVLSSNYTLGIKNPRDPGVVAYFTHDSVALAVPCDRWTKIEDNVQAIALTIEAMRGMNRWGAKHMIKAMFTGFKMLPAPESSQPLNWWQILGVTQTSPWSEIIHAYREKAMRCHPDVGGSNELMQQLNEALHRAKKAVGER